MNDIMGQQATNTNPSTGIWRVFVTVLPKAGVNDPEGEAILGGLHGLGFSQVKHAQAGRLYAVELTASSESAATAVATAMAERLLANPVIQQFAIDRVELVVGEVR